ncbi:MAG: maleylpyruvate isomerase [Actinomycetota bacterium]|nr:maleylpyruvate isomerase [Actinomycetota bacterium]
MVSMTNRPDTDIAGASVAHARLLVNLADLADEQVSQPSLLPGWSVGHVLTHLARNADSHVRMLEGAAGGRVVEQYEGGRRARAAAIEAGAARTAVELVADVRTSAERLERLWASVPDRAWDGHARGADGDSRPCVLLAFHRWREVEVHQVDLGLGPSWDDWPDEYVARELPRALATLPGRLRDPAARRRLTAWLLDRAPGPGELVVRGWEEELGHYGR